MLDLHALQNHQFPSNMTKIAKLSKTILFACTALNKHNLNAKMQRMHIVECSRC